MIEKKELFPAAAELIEIAHDPLAWRGRLLAWCYSESQTKPGQTLPPSAGAAAGSRWRWLMHRATYDIARTIRDAAMEMVAEEAVAKDPSGDTVAIPRAKPLVFVVDKPTQHLSASGVVYTNPKHPVYRVTRQSHFTGLRWDLLPADSPFRSIEPIEFGLRPPGKAVEGAAELTRIVFVGGAVADNAPDGFGGTSPEYVPEAYASLKIAKEITLIVAMGIRSLAEKLAQKIRDEKELLAAEDRREAGAQLWIDKLRHDPEGIKTHALARELDRRTQETLKILASLTERLKAKGINLDDDDAQAVTDAAELAEASK